jgi:hypothetical protein
VFCREQDVEAEVACFITLLDEVYRDLGFPNYEVALATRPAVRAGDDATWDWSEAKLGDAVRQCGLAPQINPGEGAFYGPKLEFALRDRLGRSWQCGTVQLDGVLPQRLAVPVALSLASGIRGSQRAAIFWNIFGLFDLAVVAFLIRQAIAFRLIETGFASATDGLYPAALIPAFGVPTFIILHAVSLRQLLRKNRAATGK